VDEQRQSDGGELSEVEVTDSASLLTASLLAAQERDDLLRTRCTEFLEEQVSVTESGVAFEGNVPLTLSDLFQFALSASILDRLDVSEAILRRVIDLSFDSEDGRFENVRIEDGEVERLGSFFVSPWAPLAFLQHVESLDGTESVGAEFKAEYSEKRVERWGASPYSVTPYRRTGAESIATFRTDDGNEFAGLFSRNNVIGVSFQVFAYLVHFHTMEPLEKPFFDCPAQSEMAIEALLMNVLQREAASHGVDFLRIDAWPWEKEYCLTVRHDVDRIPDKKTMNRLLRMEKAEGLGVSWFWIHDRLNHEYITRTEELGHETGLHAMKHREKNKEIQAIEHLSSQSIQGECLHGGGGGGDYWLGHPTVQFGAEAGLTYTEGLSTIHNYPYYFPVLENNGGISYERSLCLSHTMTIDSDNTPMENYIRDPEKLLEYIKNGFYVVVLNHPDVSWNRLNGLIKKLPEDDRLNWTCAEVADWWNRTHRRDALAVERVTDTYEETVYRLMAEKDVEDLEIKIPRTNDYRGDVELTADGETVTPDHEEFTDEATGEEFVRVRVDLAAGEPVELRYSTESLPAYEDIPARIPDDITGPRAEPDYLLPRVSKMTQVLANFAGVSDLTGKSVLDAGCGYGPFTTALYLSDRPARAVGADISEKYVRAGNQLCAETGMDDVEFVRSAFRELTDVLDERFDVVIVNNSINFLTSRKAYREAIREFYKVLEPGGAMVILTPNRYHLEEAFTGLKGVQFLPDRIADWYVRKKGIRDGYDDIRLPSSFELVWWLRRTGFEDVRVVDAYQFTTKGWRRHFKPRFYITARRPE